MFSIFQFWGGEYGGEDIAISQNISLKLVISYKYFHSMLIILILLYNVLKDNIILRYSFSMFGTNILKSVMSHDEIVLLSKILIFEN